MKKTDLIARYFTHKLPPEAQKEFDHLMATDTEFAKDVIFQENIKAVIKKEEEDQLKLQLKTIETTIETPRKSYLKWFAAASIIAFLALPTIWFFGNSTIDNDALFVDNFSPYRNVVHPIVRGEISNDIKTKAFTAYETKNYEEALSYFDTILNNDEDATILFYKANVLMQLEEYKKAIAILSNNTSIEKNLIAKQEWFLALAYIKTNDTQNAIATLKKLIALDSYKKETATKLLKQLD